MTRPSRRYSVFGFDSTHDALAAEEAIKQRGIDVLAIPRPKVLGTGCGIALRVLPADEPALRNVLAEAGIAWSAAGAMEDV